MVFHRMWSALVATEQSLTPQLACRGAGVGVSKTAAVEGSTAV